MAARCRQRGRQVLDRRDSNRDRARCLVGDRRAPTGADGRRPTRGVVPDRHAAGRRVSRGRTDQRHARDGAGARCRRRTPRHEGSAIAARPRAPHRPPTNRRPRRGDPTRRRPRRRQPGGRTGGGGARRRVDHVRFRRARRIRPHRRTARRRAASRRGGAERNRQCRNRFRDAGAHDRRPEHLRRHRPPGPRRRRRERPRRTGGRPHRGLVPAARARNRWFRLAVQRFGHPRCRGAGGRDAVSTATGRARRDRLRTVPSVPSGCGDSQRRRPREPRTCHDTGDGQDRNPYHRSPHRHGRAHRARRRCHRRVATGRVRRPTVTARTGRRHRAGSEDARARTDIAHRRGGGGRDRRERDRRRPTGHRRHPQLARRCTGVGTCRPQSGRARRRSGCLGHRRRRSRGRRPAG